MDTDISLQTPQKIQNQVDSLASNLASYPVIIKQFIVHCYAAVGENYINSSEGRRLAWGIGAASFGIWLAWQVPRFNPWLMRNFAHSPLSGRTYTLMTSVISHRGFLHWFFNITALSGFGESTRLHSVRCVLTGLVRAKVLPHPIG